jgi:hypothetical protein
MFTHFVFLNPYITSVSRTTKREAASFKTKIPYNGYSYGTVGMDNNRVPNRTFQQNQDNEYSHYTYGTEKGLC